MPRNPSHRRPGRPPRAAVLPARDRLVTTAARLFLERGYRAVTLDDVARAADVTRAALYYHFPDKATLSAAAMEWSLQQARVATIRLLAEPRPLRERLVTLAAVVLTLPQPLAGFDVMVLEAARDWTPDQQARVAAAQAALEAALVEPLQAAITQGVLRPGDPRIYAHAFLALIRMMQARSATGAPLFVQGPHTAHQIVAVFWCGIAGPSPEATTPL